MKKLLSLTIALALILGLAAPAMAAETFDTSATTFSPGNTCTRGQIATFLYRAFA